MIYMSPCYFYKISSWDSPFYWLSLPNQLRWCFLKHNRYVSVSEPLSLLKWFSAKTYCLFPLCLNVTLLKRLSLANSPLPTITLSFYSAGLFFKIFITIWYYKTYLFICLYLSSALECKLKWKQGLLFHSSFYPIHSIENYTLPALESVCWMKIWMNINVRKYFLIYLKIMYC